MLHACVERFDVMGERGNILGWDGEVNQALVVQDRMINDEALVITLSISISDD
jgi:hypothetical protein